MPLKAPFVALEFLMKSFINGMDFQMRLYKNDLTPNNDTVLADFVECDFSGYPAGGIVIPSFPSGTLIPPRWVSSGSPLTFNHDGGPTLNVVYGYYVIWMAQNEILWAERDPLGPKTMQALGDSYIVTPRISCRSEF